MDPIKLYDKASVWTKEKVGGAVEALDEQTPCEEWTVRDLLNHLIVSNQFFQGAARGEEASPPKGSPPDVISDDPVADYERERKATMEAFGSDEAKKKATMQLGLVFVEQLVHGWDLAKATGQDAKMPAELAEAAFQMVDGNMGADQRGTFFKPEVKVGKDASAQEKLLAYSGRKP